MEAKTKDLWVFVETKEDGSARNVGIELLTPGRELADKQQGALVAVVIGYHVEAALTEAAQHGADKIITVDGPEYKRFSTEAYANALVQLIEKYGPASVLLGATPNGRDVGPRISCRLGTGLTADCTSLDIDEESGLVVWTRPAFGGNLMARIQCPDHRPQMGTVRPGVFKKSEKTAPHAEIIREEIHISPEQIGIKVLEIIEEMQGEQVDLEGARIIVAGGRGVGGPAGFAPVRELAEALGGVVGASRAPVDAGWIAHAHQVGQTGKTVSPKLYIACGISGAIQHVAGIAGAEVVVAINKDPDAPIFQMADYCIVGDLFEILPAITRQIRQKKQQAPLTPAWAGQALESCHIEMIPPKHATKKLAADLDLFKEKFDRYMAHGFIASITDNAMGNLAFQATEVIEALALQTRPDQVLIHLNTFHQKEELDRILQTAGKLGIRNFLVVTGDGSDKMHKLLPEEIEAGDVTVTTSVELIRYIRRHYPDYILGAAFNPYEPADSEFAKLDRKLKAGATYVITQPVVGKNGQLDRLVREYPDLPVIVEVWMSKKLYLLSDVFGRPIPQDEPYDPMETLEEVKKAYPRYGNYLALLGYKTMYPALEEAFNK